MNENKPIRLNLGCGSDYLEGYINIDAPTSELSDPNIRADMYVDINELSYPNESIDEIYMEAVFEHFPRHHAILNLKKFYLWLKKNGKITVVVPDFWCTIKNIQKSQSEEEKSFWFRHLFGPQDTAYGNHYDGFDKQRLKYIFNTVGFQKYKIRTKPYQSIPNIYFTAIKTEPFLSEGEIDQNIVGYLAYHEHAQGDGILFCSWLKSIGFQEMTLPKVNRNFQTQQDSLFVKFLKTIKSLLKMIEQRIKLLGKGNSNQL